MDRALSALARRFLVRVLPQATLELRRLRRRAQAIPDAVLRHEALASIARKDFHVHGGCILATFLPAAQVRRYVGLVAAFETAVDYLDNLCDRAGKGDESDHRALHEALADAVTVGAPLRRYFRHRPGDDGGYLADLVREAQRGFGALAGYERVAADVGAITARYCELQALKHLPAAARTQRCRRAFSSIAPGLHWWEGAAACGSTLPTFALAFGAAQGCDAARARELRDAYFPYISAFHILLDYFIDQAEDRAHEELNFVACYPSQALAREGIAQIGTMALARAKATEDAARHEFCVKAMCAFYCSSPKVAAQDLARDARAIAGAVGVDMNAGPRAGRGRLLAPLLALYRGIVRS